MSIISSIAHFFVGLFNAAKKAYLQLSPDEQIALQQGSGLVNIINENLAKAPAEVRAIIQADFPNLDEAKLESVLFQAAAAFGLSGYNSLDDVIAAIQKYLSSHTDKVWETVSHSLALVLSVLFAPPAAKVSAFAQLVEWVYQALIKKHS